MLAYILALAVGLGSLGIYLAAFFLPEIHRKIDFYWSGVGLFYALMLWVCAGRLTGGVLLGQIAAVSLLGWFCWQTLTLRRQMVPAEQQTELPTTAELQSKLDGLLATVKDKIAGTRGGATKPKMQPVAKPSAATKAAAPAAVPTEVMEDWVSEDEKMVVSEPTVTTKPSPFEAIAHPESTPDDQSQTIPTPPPPTTEPETPTDSI
jgi:Ycf66 protein N-terminus